MGCGTSFVKYVLFFFNLLFALAGLALAGIGVAVLLKISEVTNYVRNMAVAPWIFIIVGAIVFIIAFFGCCGAVRESHCMVVTYSIFLLVLIIVQVVLAIMIFVYGDETKNGVDRILEDMFEKGRSNSQAHEAFSSIEIQLGCCGVRGVFDYGTSSVPESCCSTKDGIIERVLGQCSAVSAAMRPGCSAAARQFIHNVGTSFAGIAIGVAVVEVVGAIFALCLANSIRNMDRRYA